jgi:hypothetical protein
VRRVAEQAVTAIASVADVAEADFEDYYEHFMPPLINLLRVEGKDYRMLRGKAMECISLIGVAVGKEKFGTHAKSVMELFIASQQARVIAPRTVPPRHRAWSYTARAVPPRHNASV